MKSSTKLILTAAFAGTLGLAGLAKLVSATQTQSPIAVMPHSNQAVEKSDGDGETNDDVKDQQESKKLQPLAKITAQQARRSAETAEKEKATSVKLENENGNLVYTVVIGQKEVTVDAGNARVLYADTLGTDRKNNQNNDRLRSSIQVAQGMGDEDSETNDDSGMKK